MTGYPVGSLKRGFEAQVTYPGAPGERYGEHNHNSMSYETPHHHEKTGHIPESHSTHHDGCIGLVPPGAQYRRCSQTICDSVDLSQGDFTWMVGYLHCPASLVNRRPTVRRTARARLPKTGLMAGITGCGLRSSHCPMSGTRVQRLRSGK